MTNKKNHTLKHLKANEIFKLAEFVVAENFKHHSAKKGFDMNSYLNQIISVAEDEKCFFKNAKTLVYKNNLGSIEGAIRTLRWNYQDILPIEKIFGINPLEITGHSTIKSVWHIGRLAVKKSTKTLNLFKALLVNAIVPIYKNKNSIIFAECDKKLLRVLKALGIEVTILGDAIYYLESETIPICIFHEGFTRFYQKNTHLISNDIYAKHETLEKLHEIVVFKNRTANYSLV